MFTAGSVTVTVKEADAVLCETTVFDTSFKTGQFGFYNLSQDDVYYSGFVQNEFPVCDAGGSNFGSAGLPIQFDGSGSFDPDGTIVSYEWDFGDGSSGAGVIPTHTYARDGDYTVTLCVVDDDGGRQRREAPIPGVDTENSSVGALKERF